MSFLDDYPQRKKPAYTADAAEAAFRNAIQEYDLFVVQQEDRRDYGTDLQIEVRDGESMTNIRAHVQLKGTESALRPDGSVSVRIARTNLNYLLSQPYSLYVCHHLPSARLFVRSAEDVFREYEHAGRCWTSQQTVTIRFAQTFDESFQRQLHSHILASAKSSRDRRLKWVTTPPRELPALVRNEVLPVEVPADTNQAIEVLEHLYKAGEDAIISEAFGQFAAALSALPEAMIPAYMAEINLGVNGQPFDENRIKKGMEAISAALGAGHLQEGSGLYCLGNAWLALGDYQEASDLYQRALGQLRDPQAHRIAAQCYKNLGAAFEKLGRIDDAGKCYEESLEVDPELCEARFALALYERSRQNFGAALEHLDRVVRQSVSALDISSVQAWRTELLFITGDTEGAFREINSLICQRNVPDYVWPWCARLVAQYGKMTDAAARKAITFWRAYLGEHSPDAGAKRELLLCLWRLHMSGDGPQVHFEAFKREVTELIEAGAFEPAYLWDRIGHWAQRDGRWEDAEKAYRQAYELEPQRYGYCLATACNFLDRHDEALSILSFLIKEPSADAMTWFQTAVAHEGTGDIDASIQAYWRALQLDPNYDLAWFNLGGMYWNHGDKTQASELWAEAVRRFPNHELARKLRQDLPVLFE